jgi:uncharacterized protein YabE (DUF348 family)
MKNKYGWLALGLVFCGLAVLGLSMRKTVYIFLNDQTEPISLVTWSWRVDDALKQAGIDVNPGDILSPSAETIIWHNTQVKVDRAVQYQIATEGNVQTLTSLERIPANVLALAGISIFPGDTVSIDGQLVNMEDEFPYTKPEVFLTFMRGTAITIFADGHTLPLYTQAGSVAQALWDAGIRLHTTDLVQPDLSAPITTDMQIQVTRSKPVTIQTAQDTINLLSAANTVGDALVDAGLALQGLDYAVPGASESIPADGFIRLVRVQEAVQVDQTPVDFETAYQPVDSLEIDSQTVLEPGEYGIEAQRIRVRYEDGVEVSRQLEEKWLARQPKTRVVGYGTQIVMRTTTTADGETINYWRALTVYATSYKPSSAGGSITSTGKVLKKGIIAVNPRYIPYGTILYVPGYGYGEAADTGNLPARWVDLGYTDEDFEGWHQNITLYFIWPPPTNIVWIIP